MRGQFRPDQALFSGLELGIFDKAQPVNHDDKWGANLAWRPNGHVPSHRASWLFCGLGVGSTKRQRWVRRADVVPDKTKDFSRENSAHGLGFRN